MAQKKNVQPKVCREISSADMQRFHNFLKSEPLVPLLNRNISFLLDKGKRIQSLEINDKLKSYTDGKRVVVSCLPCFITPDYGKDVWTIDLRVSLSHEIQHDNSSDFELVEKIQEFYGSYLKKFYGINKTIGEKFAQYFLNCVEDGRINEIVVQRFPGYLNMMRFVNYAIRDYNTIEEKAKTPEDEFDHFSAQIISYAKTGMNVKGIGRYKNSRLETEFMKIRDLIDEAVASKTAKDCFDACVNALNVVAPYVAELCKNESAILDFLQSLHLENYSQSSKTREEEEGDGGGSGTRITIRKQKKSSSKPNKQSEQNDQSGFDDSDGDESNQGSKSEKKSKKGDSEKSSGKSGNAEDAAEDDDSSKGASSESSKDDAGNSDGTKDPSKGDSGENSDKGDESSSDSKDKKDTDKSADSSKGKKPTEEDAKSLEAASEQAKKKGPQSIDEVLGSGFGEDENSPLTEDEVVDIMKAAKEDLHKTAEAEKENVVDTGRVSNLSPKERNELKTRYRFESFSETFVQPTKKQVPQAILEPARNLHRKLEKILINKKTAAAGHKKGYINTNHLWKTGINDGNIFSRKTPPTKTDCVFYQLIDRSGSMASLAFEQGNTYVSKLATALTTGAIVEEALKGIASTKVVCFDYNRGKVRHAVVKDYDQQPIGSRCYDALTKVSADGCNMDGYSIRVAAMDLAKRPEKQKILIVLSDGLPSAYNCEDEGIGDVRSAVIWARTQGIIVIPIMFGEEDFFRSSFDDYKTMYEKNIIACKPGNIINEFEKLLIKLFR